MALRGQFASMYVCKLSACVFACVFVYALISSESFTEAIERFLWLETELGIEH